VVGIVNLRFDNLVVYSRAVAANNFDIITFNQVLNVVKNSMSRPTGNVPVD